MTLHAVQANAACDFAFVTCVLHAAPFSLTREGFPAWRAEMHKDPGGKGRRDLWRPLHRSDRAGRLLCPVPAHGVRSECPPVRREHGGSETLAGEVLSAAMLRTRQSELHSLPV